MPGSCVPYGVRVKVLRMQHNHWSRIFFSIQECIFGIRPIRGKMRSAVWTVWDDVKSCNTKRICYYKYNAYYSKGASVNPLPDGPSCPPLSDGSRSDWF
jgi:hypothetical protein